MNKTIESTDSAQPRPKDLGEKIANYPIHALRRTSKTCEFCENGKADFYIEWEFPHYRDYFCLRCGTAASPEHEPDLLLLKLRESYRRNFKNGKSDDCFLMWVEGQVKS